MPSKFSRRKLLQSVGIVCATGSFSGCSGLQTTQTEPSPDTDDTPASDSPPTLSELSGGVEPAGDPPQVVDEFECSEYPEFKRPAQNYLSVHRGDNGTASTDPTLALRVEPLELRKGDELTLTLTNVSNERAGRAWPMDANFEVYTANGWVEIRGYTDGTAAPIPAGRIEMKPGEQAQWSFPMTEQGIVTAFRGAPNNLAVCPGLPVGRYRYVSTVGVAVAFDLVE